MNPAEITNTLVVVADSARARLLSLSWPGPSLVEREALVFPEARLKEAGLTSDQSGRTFDSHGVGRHALDGATAKEHNVVAFAKLVTNLLETMRLQAGFNQLVIVAAPRFLGALRQQMPAHCTPLVIGEIDKDMTQRSLADIAELIGSKIQRPFTA